MPSLPYRITLVGLVLLSACVSTRSVVRETITISRRPWYAVCAGTCPNFDLTVWPDGRVLVIRHSLAGDPDELERFQVSPADVASFRSKLLPYRPADDWPAPAVCNHTTSLEEAPLVMKVTEIEIRWSGTDKAARLQASANQEETAPLVEAIGQALWSVDLNVIGQRRD
jgi:hypothetical protein